MQTDLKKISAAMQRKAKVCETIAQDKTQEALTGESKDKELNEQEAKGWREKSKVWQEAEAIVHDNSTGPPSSTDKNAKPI